MDEFFPETYRLDIREERQVFFTLFDGERSLDQARHAAGRQSQGGMRQEWAMPGEDRTGHGLDMVKDGKGGARAGAQWLLLRDWGGKGCVLLR
jgi:hypothetical protein